jgi:hypothetical protein
MAGAQGYKNGRTCHITKTKATYQFAHFDASVVKKPEVNHEKTAYQLPQRLGISLRSYIQTRGFKPNDPELNWLQVSSRSILRQFPISHDQKG